MHDDDKQAKVAAAVRQLLVALGEDTEREGLRDTPGRVARGYAELLAGTHEDPERILNTAFESDGYDSMVTLRGVSFYSLCEHHLLPFHGTVTLAYIPNGKVVGLSKLARLVECYARRLQIQERMTEQIAKAMSDYLSPKGYGVLVRAQHLCMCARGVRKPNSEMITTKLGGVILGDHAKAEFLRYAEVSS